MKKNNCLNLFKFTACIGVVFIHVTFPGIFGTALQYLSHYAVPVFFMIAGFYSYGCDEKKLKSRVKKIFKILLFGIIIYLIWQIPLQYLNGNIRYFFKSNFTPKAIFYFFVFCTIPWAIPLWYLIAIIETYLFWIFVSKKNLQTIIEKNTLLLLILGAITTSIVDTAALDWSYKINFLFRALPWFLLGFILNKRISKATYRRIPIKQLIILVFLGWGITLCSALFATVIDVSYFGVLLTAPALFMIGIQNPDIKIHPIINFISDRLALYIYILHVPVSGYINLIRSSVFKFESPLYYYIHPIITLIVTLLLSWYFDILVSIITNFTLKNKK